MSLGAYLFWVHLLPSPAPHNRTLLLFAPLKNTQLRGLVPILFSFAGYSC